VLPTAVKRDQTSIQIHPTVIVSIFRPLTTSSNKLGTVHNNTFQYLLPRISLRSFCKKEEQGSLLKQRQPILTVFSVTQNTATSWYWLSSLLCRKEGLTFKTTSQESAGLTGYTRPTLPSHCFKRLRRRGWKW
jgi:hypothetical protein